MMTDEELQRVLEQYKKKRNCSSEAMLKHFAEVLSCELFDYMAFARGKNEGINEGKSDLSNEIMHWINSKNRGSADYLNFAEDPVQIFDLGWDECVLTDAIGIFSIFLNFSKNHV